MMNSRDEHKQEQSLKRLSLSGDKKMARELAEQLRRGGDPLLTGFFHNSPRRIRLLADASEGALQFEPTSPTCEHIVTAWRKLYFRAGSHSNGFDPFAFPTLREVQQEFVRLFGEQAAPKDWTIRKTLQRLQLQLRPGKVGRPKKGA